MLADFVVPLPKVGDPVRTVFQESLNPKRLVRFH